MNIRSNRYNDPALGEAFNNIASIFAPPSAQDMAGYATAAAKKQEREQMAWMFENAMDPLASARSAVTGVQSYGNTPVGFGMTDATNRRGQDITASTSITNNTADNARALATNAADNQRAVDTNAADNSRSFAETIYGMKVAPGETTVPLPSSVAGMYNVEPRGAIAGAPKPMSETEVRGGERLDLRESGMLTDDMLLDEIFGSQTPVKTAGPDGGAVFSTPGAAARTGAPAFVDEGSKAAPDVQNYRAPDGTSGTAVYRDGTGWVDTQTNQPIPQGSLTMKANATGSADEVIGPRPQNLTRARQLRSDITSMNSLVGELETTIRSAAGTAGLAASIQSFFQDSRQVVKELAAATGEDPNAPITPEGLKALSENLLGVERGYNPTFRRVHAMMLDLAYMNARLNNPSGEVSRFALEREIEALGQGMTGNDQSVLAAIDVARQRMARGLSQAEVLEGRNDGSTLEEVLQPAGGPVGPEIGEVVEGHRFLGGDPAQQSSWEKVQ